MAADQQLLKGVWWGFNDALLSNPATVIEFDIFAIFLRLFARYTIQVLSHSIIFFWYHPTFSSYKKVEILGCFLQWPQLKFIVKSEFKEYKRKRLFYGLANTI